MGVDMIAPALSLASAGTSFARAQSQSRAIRSSISSVGDAAQTEVNQLSASADLERMKALNETRAIIGRIRAASGGSTRSLVNQAAFDGAINQRIIDQNFEAAVGAVRSELSARVGSLASNYTSPILAAFAGGASGLQQGLILQQQLQPPSLGVASYGAGGNMAGPPDIGAGPPPSAPFYLRPH